MANRLFSFSKETWGNNGLSLLYSIHDGCLSSETILLPLTLKTTGTWICHLSLAPSQIRQCIVWRHLGERLWSLTQSIARWNMLFPFIIWVTTVSLSNEIVDVPDVKDNSKSGSRTFFLSVLDTIPHTKKDFHKLWTRTLYRYFIQRKSYKFNLKLKALMPILNISRVVRQWVVLGA